MRDLTSRPPEDTPLQCPHPLSGGEGTDFSGALLVWYATHRRDLPWRRTRDPYAILVSEMMLQQTQVATVIPYWTRWMERFPTIAALANAPLDDVLKHWQGLGYYARARNLHRTAQTIVERHAGVFPVAIGDVLALPGVGRYTAGAVCSIAFHQDVPVVDANVIRVLCRYFGIEGDPKTPPVIAKLWDLAQALIPAGEASTFNQAMMELGALVCVAKPRCGACPLATGCTALASGAPESLPRFAPRPVFTTQTDVSAVIAHPSGDGRVLLVRRPVGGLWGGLHELPRVTADAGEPIGSAAVRAAREVVGLAATATENDVLGRVRHGVTTRKITLVGVACKVLGDAQPQPVGCDACFWVPLKSLDDYALSSPQARLMEILRDGGRQPSLF